MVQTSKPVVKEIERKFLVSQTPADLKTLQESQIFQTYLAIGIEEVRIRMQESNNHEEFTMNIKNGSGLIRTEDERNITKLTYLQILESTNKRALSKVRKNVQIDSHIGHLDIYSNPQLKGLVTIEVEFSSEEESNSFKVPEWFGEDVTNDPQYKNQNLWLKIQE